MYSCRDWTICGRQMDGKRTANDRTLNKHGRQIDGKRMANAWQIEGKQMAYRQQTDEKQTAARRQTEGELTANWRRTDVGWTSDRRWAVGGRPATGRRTGVFILSVILVVGLLAASFFQFTWIPLGVICWWYVCFKLPGFNCRNILGLALNSPTHHTKFCRYKIRKIAATVRSNRLIERFNNKYFLSSDITNHHGFRELPRTYQWNTSCWQSWILYFAKFLTILNIIFG